LTPDSLGHGFSNYQNVQRRKTIDTSTTVKAKILESKVSSNEKFFNLTEGFQRAFSND
jgi:hypothetical protein